VQINILLPILVGLLLAISLYVGFSRWQRHQQRQRGTAERGWRYTSSLLHSLLRPHYVIAGHTPTRVIWEMRRTSQRGLLLFIWTTSGARLPYGLIRILPRRAAVSRTNPLPIHLAVWQNKSWQQPVLSDYIVLTSHQQLGERFLTQEVALALSHWPEWPLPGALESVTWDPHILEIQVRHFDDWATADRLVALGTALVTSSQLPVTGNVAQRPLRVR
jgi:hypothetical protein